MHKSEANTPKKAIFSEKLIPSPWSFIIAAICWPSVWLVFLPINETVGIWAGAALTGAIWAVMVITSARIEVANGELTVGAAHIPLRFLGAATEVLPDDRFAERGPRLDARAFIRFQAGVAPLVKIVLNDQDDPTPYWLVATRKPKELIAALTAES